MLNNKLKYLPVLIVVPMSSCAHCCTHVFITEALKLYRGKLTAFEQTEILDYPEIWFLGLEAKKIEGEPGSAQNNGYDDENGSYIKVQHLS